jgi:hypothetical protein
MTKMTGILKIEKDTRTLLDDAAIDRPLFAPRPARHAIA